MLLWPTFFLVKGRTTMIHNYTVWLLSIKFYLRYKAKSLDHEKIDHCDLHCLRNRFLLTVIYCSIYHWLEVSRKVDISRARSASDIITDDWQPVIYWATNHLLARIYFDSNTHETTKKQLYPSDFSSFLPLYEEIPLTTLTVIEVFTCIS